MCIYLNLMILIKIIRGFISTEHALGRLAQTELVLHQGPQIVPSSMACFLFSPQDRRNRPMRTQSDTLQG
ncbi:hypothetical protein EKQ45_00255 (plasmid) [Proteus vulgaris]|nr:hypothetical protein EKQ45_00255 [Proteus vulgaris]